MGPYSHFFLAAKLAPSLQPEQRSEYLWGAVAPDIRYLANLRREHTHLELNRIKALAACYPHLRSFLMGYQVHLLIDQVDVALTVGSAFPLSLLKKVLRKSISPQQITMLVEMHYLQSGPAGKPLEGTHNEVLSDLGISPEQTRTFQQTLREYFENRSSEAAINAFQRIGMIQNARVEKYLNAYRAMQKRKALQSLLMLSIKNARLDARVMEHVQSGMAG